MLVQSSDNLEDVIDMSSDNLARLKEEALMIEMDRIVRYIRIFSELSGQIRYASQKRILVEIALIKLCKPDMETTPDSLIDRIRQVEDKVENGVVMVQGTAPEGGTTGAAPVSSAAPRPQLPKAIPDDIKAIVAKWPSICGNADNPMRMYMKMARLSLGADNTLQMVMEDGPASDYFNRHPENKQQLEYILADFAGKEVAVSIQTVNSEREFEDHYVDLSHVIHMEIEEED